jgi:DNA-binding response OmpR family regulator
MKLKIEANPEMRILLIEDEPRMVELLHKGLSEHGHEVSATRNGADGLKLTLDHEFDVVLLDVGLPGLSGDDVAQVLRERKSTASILMLTAFNKEDEIVRGLNLGADDYLTKPFSFPELLARLRSVTRVVPDSGASASGTGLVLDRMHHKVTRNGRGIELTRTEFTLLELLLRNSPDPVSRVKLVAGIWGEEKDVTHGALDVLVNSLRGKIDIGFADKLVQTVRGFGYALKSGQAVASVADFSRRRQ